MSEEQDEGVIRCICRIVDDDGFTIQCEKCYVWQHAVCVGIQIDTVPELYFCEQCEPRYLDLEVLSINKAAIIAQTSRQKLVKANEKVPRKRRIDGGLDKRISSQKNAVNTKSANNPETRGALNGMESSEARKSSRAMNVPINTSIILPKSLKQLSPVPQIVRMPPPRQSDQIRFANSFEGEYHANAFNFGEICNCIIDDSALDSILYIIEHAFDPVTLENQADAHKTVFLSREYFPPIFGAIQQQKFKPFISGLAQYGITSTIDIPDLSFIAEIKGVMCTSKHLDLKSYHTTYSIDTNKNEGIETLVPPFVFPIPFSTSTSKAQTPLWLDTRDFGSFDGRFVRFQCTSNKCTSQNYNAVIKMVILVDLKGSTDGQNCVNYSRLIKLEEIDANTDNLNLSNIKICLFATRDINADEEIIAQSPLNSINFPCTCDFSNPCSLSRSVEIIDNFKRSQYGGFIFLKDPDIPHCHSSISLQELEKSRMELIKRQSVDENNYWGYDPETSSAFEELRECNSADFEDDSSNFSVESSRSIDLKLPIKISTLDESPEMSAQELSEVAPLIDMGIDQTMTVIEPELIHTVTKEVEIIAVAAPVVAPMVELKRVSLRDFMLQQSTPLPSETSSTQQIILNVENLPIVSSPVDNDMSVSFDLESVVNNEFSLVESEINLNSSNVSESLIEDYGEIIENDISLSLTSFEPGSPIQSDTDFKSPGLGDTVRVPRNFENKFSSSRLIESTHDSRRISQSRIERPLSRNRDQFEYNRSENLARTDHRSSRREQGYEHLTRRPDDRNTRSYHEIQRESFHGRNSTPTRHANPSSQFAPATGYLTYSRSPNIPTHQSILSPSASYGGDRSMSEIPYNGRHVRRESAYYEENGRRRHAYEDRSIHSAPIDHFGEIGNRQIVNPSELRERRELANRRGRGSYHLKQRDRSWR